jgi:hypothetical protein
MSECNRSISPEPAATGRISTYANYYVTMALPLEPIRGAVRLKMVSNQNSALTGGEWGFGDRPTLGAAKS